MLISTSPTYARVLAAAAFILAGSPTLSGSTGQEVLAAQSAPRAISFSGYDWNVRNSAEPSTPDNNYFSDSNENAWVDTAGRLHLRITRSDGRWQCAEVVLTRSLGHGIYVFHVASSIGELDENVVLGLFHYDYHDTYPFHREMDIEFSRWGIPESPNAQYVVQPWESSGNLYRWSMPVSLDSSTHTYYWTTDSILFLSARGHQSGPPFESVLDQWTYKRAARVPQPGEEQVRVNLWLSLARPPSDSIEPEVTLSGFKHIPEPMVRRRPGSSLPRHRILQNQPNPFRAGTSLRYELRTEEDVSIRIYDTSGRAIRTVVDERRMPGVYESFWDGLDASGGKACSGVYMCHMTAGQTRNTIQIILVR